MGRTSKILSPAEIREKKAAERAVLKGLKDELREQRSDLKELRATLKSASTLFGKAERQVTKTRNAIQKQEDRIAAF